jgi:hypothetical protein
MTTGVSEDGSTAAAVLADTEVGISSAQSIPVLSSLNPAETLDFAIVISDNI